MTYVADRSYKERIKETLVSAQMLALRHPEAGIKPESLYEYSNDEIIGIYRYLNGLDDDE